MFDQTKNRPLSTGESDRKDDPESLARYLCGALGDAERVSRSAGSFIRAAIRAVPGHEEGNGFCPDQASGQGGGMMPDEVAAYYIYAFDDAAQVNREIGLLLKSAIGCLLDSIEARAHMTPEPVEHAAVTVH